MTSRAKLLAIAIAILMAGIAVMIFLIVRAAMSGPSAPVSTYDFNLQRYQAQVNSNPKDSQARINLAQTYLMAKDYDKAREHLDVAVKGAGKMGSNSKQMSLAHYLLGGINKFQGLPDKAIDELKTALKLDDSSDRAWFQLGLMYDGEKQYAKAIDCFKKVIVLQPYAADAHYQLGLLYTKTGNNGKALKELQTAQKFMPGDTAIADAIKKVSGGK